MNQKNHSSDILQLTNDDAKAAIRFAEEVKDFVINLVNPKSNIVKH